MGVQQTHAGHAATALDRTTGADQTMLALHNKPDTYQGYTHVAPRGTPEKLQRRGLAKGCSPTQAAWPTLRTWRGIYHSLLGTVSTPPPLENL